MKLRTLFPLFLLSTAALAAEIDLSPKYNSIKRELVRGNSEKALSELNAILEKNPAQARAYSLRANAFFLKNQYKEAVEDYSRVIQLQPSNAKAFLDRGMVLLLLGEQEMAKRDIQRAVFMEEGLKKLIRTRPALYKQVSSVIE